MLTRQGVVAALAGVVALVVGRVFGVVELFVIGAAFEVAVVAALVFVSLRTPAVTGTRWIHPRILVAGDVGRVDIQLHHDGALRSTRFVLHERVGRAGAGGHTAVLDVEPLAPRSDAAAGYRLPTSQRGVIRLGPLTAEVRDPLGIARRTRAVAGSDQVTVAPRAHLLEMPTLGSGPLGRQLLASARRLGPGEFHALREYADGDEPRSIHWKASARSESLYVKEYAVEGLRRALVLFDADPASYADPSSFERGVTAAASIVKSADVAGLTTRFVSGGGVDHRGPDVAEMALRLLAEVEPDDRPIGQLDRSPGEGVGMLVVITGSIRSGAWRAASAVMDPSMTIVPVTTDESARGVTGAAARTEAEFLATWRALTGGATRRGARRRDAASAATDADARVTLERSAVDDAIASATLLVFTLAVAAGFARVFSGWAFFDNLAMVAVAGHTTAFVLRRARFPLVIAFPLTMAVLCWLIGAMFYRGTYTMLLPTSDTWALFRLELDLVGEQFRTAVAPVAFLGGWDVLAAIGIAAVALLSDTFAFRAYARAEALVPGGVLFVFVAALGDDRRRIALTVLLVAAGVATTAVLRSHHAPRRSATIGRRPRTLAVAIPAATVTALVVAAAAGAVGPRLPGAEAEPIYETKGGRSGSVTEVLSPLVDIRSRLTNRENTEMFTVRANAPAYWRSSALPKFDGRTWGLPERGLQRVDGTLTQARAGAVEIRQSVTVSALGGALLPAAAEPIAVSGSDSLRFNADASTLVETDGDLTAGDAFEIVSAAPRFDAAQLAVATSTDPGDPIYLELPDDFPSSVAVTAREVVGADATPFEAALRLQEWMRTEFTYSLEVQPGHGSNAIEQFLRDRIGYCEQFAGTYAAMLRAVGIPARVAVGFTPGVDDGTGLYSVRGRNAHAWPEVWFDGYGWVLFEPTPGRGAPGADYTTRSPEQAPEPVGDDGADGEGGSGDDDGSSTPTTQPAPALGDGATPNTTIPDLAPSFPDQLDGVDGAGEGAAAASGGGSSASPPWGWIAAALLAVLAAFVPAMVRRIRRRTHRSPEVEVRRLWARAVTAVGLAGVHVHADQTPLEVAAATAGEFPTAGRPMSALASSITEAVYGTEGPDLLSADGTYGSTLLGNCSVWCRQIEKAVDDSISPAERFRRHFTVWS